MEPSELFAEVSTEQLSNQEYHGVSAEIVSNSRLSVFRRNPQEYYQRYITREIPDEDSDALVFGRVFHEAILERATDVDGKNCLSNTLGIFRVCSTPQRDPDVKADGEDIWFADLPEQGIVRRSKWWGELNGGRVWSLSPEREGQLQAGYCAFEDMLVDGDHFETVRRDVLSDAGRKQGKRWTEWKESFPEDAVLYKPSEFADLLSMRRELRAHPLTRQILFGPQGPNRHTEYTIRGIDRKTGLQVQTRLDFCRRDCDGALVVDLKSSRDASPGCWKRQAERDGLHVQAAIQTGLAQLHFGCEVEFRFAVVQKDAPYRVEVFELEPEFIELGVEDYLRDITRFAECVNSGHWYPKGYGEVQKLQAPAYRMMDKQLAWHNPDGSIGFFDEDP